MLIDNLYYPPDETLNEGTHTYGQIQQYIHNRYNSDKPVESEKQFLKRAALNNHFNDLLNKERYGTSEPFYPGMSENEYKKMDKKMLKTENLKRGYKKDKTNNSLKHVGATLAAGGLALAGLHRYATKNPNSFLGRKLAALKAKFGRG